jgi:hypothetical protein
MKLHAGTEQFRPDARMHRIEHELRAAYTTQIGHRPARAHPCLPRREGADSGRVPTDRGRDVLVVRLNRPLAASLGRTNRRIPATPSVIPAKGSSLTPRTGASAGEAGDPNEYGLAEPTDLAVAGRTRDSRTRPVHLLLGHSGDSCCTGVLARLAARGLPAYIVQSPLAPPARLAWHLADDGLTSRLDLGDDPVEIAGVLVRGTPWFDPAGWAPVDHAYMQSEMLAATLAWLAGLPCPVINRPSAALWYGGRVPLLRWHPLLRRCGLLVPEQVITNDRAAARAFRRRLADDGVTGAVYAPLTGGAGYLVAIDAAWEGLADLQERSPVCLSEPHGAAHPACIVGGEVVWDDDAPPECRALAPRLRQLAAETRLDFLEVAIAPLRHGLGVVMVEPIPVLEHFAAPTRARILDALTALLAPVAAEAEAVQ